MILRRLLAALSAAAIALAAATTARGEVRWLEVVHNFGAFDEDGGTVRCNFTMVNKGPDDVSVRTARASCGCTTPSFPHKALAPGDTAQITVAYNPIGRPGRFNKTVKVTLSDGVTQILSIRGVVIGSQNTLRSRYPIDAGAVKLRSRQVPFGTVHRGGAKSSFLEVYNASREPISPRWTHVPSYLRVTASADTIAPGEQEVYSMVLTPTKSDIYGILTDSLFLEVPGTDPVKVDITAIVEEDFSKLTPGQLAAAPVISIEPERVDFGEFPADGDLITLPFEISNKGKSDLLLRRAYTIDPGVTVVVRADKVKKGKSVTGYITVDPRALPAPLLNARIQLITNDPANPLAIVRAVGIPTTTSD